MKNSNVALNMEFQITWTLFTAMLFETLYNPDTENY